MASGELYEAVRRTGTEVLEQAGAVARKHGVAADAVLIDRSGTRLGDHGSPRKDRYDRFGRWLLAAAVLGGWVVGVGTQVPELALKLMTAGLGGGVILNVMKEELPEETPKQLLGSPGGSGWLWRAAARHVTTRSPDRPQESPA